MPKGILLRLSPNRTAPTKQIAFLIALLGLPLYLAFLGDSRVLTAHEVYFAQPAQEMLESGNYLTTTFGGVHYNHKPPLTSWIIAATLKLFGRDEFMIRLPFALAAIAAAIITGKLVERWLGRETGLIAGLCQLTSYFSLMQGRLAESDILLLLWVSNAYWLFALGALPTQPTDSRSRWQSNSIWFYLSCVLGFLSKGPIACIFIFGGIGCWLLITRRWAGFKFLLGQFWQPVVFSALLLAWPVAAYLNDPTIISTWRQHNVGRFLGEMGGIRPWWFYLPNIALLLLPWTFFVPAGLFVVFRNRRHSASSLSIGETNDANQSYFSHTTLMLAWSLVGIIFLSCSQWKFKHYSVPTLPPLCGLAAAGVSLGLRRMNNCSPPSVTAISVIVGGVVVGLYYSNLLPKEVEMICTLAAILGGLGFYATRFLATRGHPPANALMPIILVCIAIAMLTFAKIVPEFDSYRPLVAFIERCNESIPKTSNVLIYGLPEFQGTFYLKHPNARIDQPNLLVQEIRNRRVPSFVIAPAEVAQTFSNDFELQELDHANVVRHNERLSQRATLFRISPHADKGVLGN